MQKSDYLKVALEAVKTSEKVIKNYFSKRIDINFKSDQTPVTVADQEVEKIIIQTIKKHYPEYSFLGEEFGSEDNRHEFVWIIDPIDGTKNFIRGIPFFATQIALVKNGKIILGVSNAPMINELMFAEVGQGAFLNGKQIKVSSLSELNKSFLSYGSLRSFQDCGYLDGLVNLAKKVQSARGFGDCLSYHLLAQGKIDIMVEAKMKIWDVAALKIIIEEAGGIVTDINGDQFGMESTSIIASNGKIHKMVVAKLR